MPDAVLTGADDDRETVPDDAPPAAGCGEPAYGVPARAATTTPVRFAGGPWHGRRARYVDVREPTPMPCPGGRYCPGEPEADGTIVYAFAAG